MIGPINELERGSIPEPFANRLEKLQPTKVVSGSLQEQHGHGYVREMRRAGVTGFARRMQRETKEDNSTHTGERRLRRGRGGHAAAKRFSAGQERQTRRGPSGGVHGCTNGARRHIGSVGAVLARLHVGKLVAERPNVVCGERVSDAIEKGMPHAGARAVRDHVERSGVRRELQKRGDRPRAGLEGELYRLAPVAATAPSRRFSCATYHSASRSSAWASYSTPSLMVHFTPPYLVRSLFGTTP